MNRLTIDRILGQTPCICGSTVTWHPECYRGKTDAQLEAARVRVYAKVRCQLAKKRRQAAATILRHCGDKSE